MPIVRDEVKVDVEIEIQVWCSECGAGLCGTVNVNGTNETYIDLPPCEKCMEAAKEDAYNEGFDKGQEEGYAAGYQAKENERGV